MIQHHLKAKPTRGALQAELLGMCLIQGLVLPRGHFLPAWLECHPATRAVPRLPLSGDTAVVAHTLHPSLLCKCGRSSKTITSRGHTLNGGIDYGCKSESG